jgi:hypothetical protein
MKKVLTIALLCAAVAVTAADYKFKQVRLDLRSIKDTTLSKPASGEGLRIAVKTPKDADEDLSAVLFYSDTLSDQWQKLTLEFVPEDDGWINLAIHTPGARGELERISPVWVDNIQVTGGKLRNGDFETLKDGKLADWRLTKDAKLIPGKGMNNSNCVQVFHGSGMLGQAIRVKADEKVTLTLYARLAE